MDFTTFFMKIFNESGLIAALFVSSFLYFMYKGIPYVLSLHKEIIIWLTTSYSDSLDKAISAFNIQIEKSNAFHENHIQWLAEVKDAIWELKSEIFQRRAEDKQIYNQNLENLNK